MPIARRYTPVLVIGGGLAGGVVALLLADRGIPVTLLMTSAQKDNGNSWKAQGGIIYRSPDEDDAKKLAHDIFVAGHHHNSAEAVHFLCDHGPKAVEDILVNRLNIPFDRHISSESDETSESEVLPESDWDLTREGGHSSGRILHCADHTGQSIMDYLQKAISENQNITVVRGATAIDLLTSHHHTTGMVHRYQLQNQCCGAYVLNEATGGVETILANFTVLATGGVGQIYLHSTNAPSAVGSGVAMASRAFVRLENMEYMQFHPTTFYQEGSQRFLITEALRGEGAHLVNAAGKRFMPAYDARVELAPRDIVARAILDEMLKTGEPCVYLDTSPVKHDIRKRFPTVYEACMKCGVDPTSQPIPVVPAAHYFCGGILCDMAGRTSLHRLYSVGESSCTGVHGANRLASTSLLESLLWGQSTAEDISSLLAKPDSRVPADLFDSIRDWEHKVVEKNDDPALIAQDWLTIRTTMWNYVGISRSESRLSRAFVEMRDLSRTVHSFYHNTPVTRPLVDLFHGCQTAYLITQAALRNRKSLGCHYRI